MTAAPAQPPTQAQPRLTSRLLHAIPHSRSPAAAEPRRSAADAADALAGWVVAVTGVRRADDVILLLQQRGAQVVHAPALRIAPLVDSPLLHDATMECLREPLDVVVATSDIGFRGWLEAADGWDVGEELRAQLAAAVVLARGPKTRGAVAVAGLTDGAGGQADSTWHLLARLLSMPLRGMRIAVQLHGSATPDFTAILRTAGAHVIELPVYRSLPPENDSVLERLLALITNRQVHAATFTSAAALENLLATAERSGTTEDLLACLHTAVTAVCVGSVTAAPLERAGVPTVQPSRARLGALVHALAETLADRTVHVRTGEHHLQVRGTGVVIDGRFRSLPPAPMAVLRTLLRRPGHVMSLGTLLAALPGDSEDAHSVEMAVRRLRLALGDPRCVENVVKRGYRLAQPADDTTRLGRSTDDVSGMRR